MAGSGTVKPADEDELKQLRVRYGSPEKQMRVDGCMGSGAMK